MTKQELRKLFEQWVLRCPDRDPLTIELMSQLLVHAEKFIDLEHQLYEMDRLIACQAAADKRLAHLIYLARWTGPDHPLAEWDCDPDEL